MCNLSLRNREWGQCLNHVLKSKGKSGICGHDDSVC